MQHPRVAILTAGGKAPAILINALVARFPGTVVILEKPEGKRAFLRRRAKKIGWVRTLGQFPIMVASRFLKPLVAKRFSEIEREHSVSMQWPDTVETHRLDTANSAAFPELLNRLKIDVLFVVGARMLDRKTLAAIACPKINFHAGMTPDYRGLNGGYWALVEGRPERFGGTVHLIDNGVDTGAVIASRVCIPGKSDTIMSYQHTITAQCVPDCVKAVDDVATGNATWHMPEGRSAQHYHPELWLWIWTGITRGIW